MKKLTIWILARRAIPDNTGGGGRSCQLLGALCGNDYDCCSGLKCSNGVCDYLTEGVDVIDFSSPDESEDNDFLDWFDDWFSPDNENTFSEVPKTPEEKLEEAEESGNYLVIAAILVIVGGIIFFTLRKK